eukprot:1141193-Pelagomonas_calceolata.AAC.1
MTAMRLRLWHCVPLLVFLNGEATYTFRCNLSCLGRSICSRSSPVASQQSTWARSDMWHPDNCILIHS